MEKNKELIDDLDNTSQKRNDEVVLKSGRVELNGIFAWLFYFHLFLLVFRSFLQIATDIFKLM
jgi:hypothetical protein